MKIAGGLMAIALVGNYSYFGTTAGKTSSHDRSRSCVSSLA
jgi:hypothetical protein